VCDQGGDEAEFDDFEWDESKSERNLEERGYDYEFASGVFDGPYTERTDTRRRYRELRYVVIGEVDGFIIRLGWTSRGRNRRILSSRPAKRHEESKYRAYRKTTKQEHDD
jgi:uncharacterized DUF497 family protein